MSMGTPRDYIGYIYCITNHLNGKQYVGQTNVSVDSRYNEHIRCAIKTESHLLLYRSIRKYGVDNFSVDTIDTVSAESASELKALLNELEIRYIAELNTYMPNGYNMTKGGYAFSNHVTTGVYAVNEDGIVLAHYSSMRNAQHETGVEEDAIGHACKSKSHYAKGLFWYFDTCDFSIGANIGKQRRGKTNWLGHKSYSGKSVNRYSRDFKFIDTFVSAAEAARQLNICQAHISRCCLGDRKTAGGYRWSFAN